MLDFFFSEYYSRLVSSIRRRSRMYRAVCTYVLLVFLIAQFSYATADEQKTPPSDKSTVEDVIPLTMGNIRGHKMLYNEGWFIVTSSSKAFAYAREKSLISSKDAITRAVKESSRHSGEYTAAIKIDVRESVETGTGMVASGTKGTGKILTKTHELATAELGYAGENFQKAMASFVRGNMTIAERTAEDRREMMGLPGNYFSSLKHDFSNVYDLTQESRQHFVRRIDPEWESAFQKAAGEFRSEYERSGEEPNSLMALGPLLAGYLKSFYHGLVAPASKSIVKTTVAGTTYAVFLPLAATTIVAGRTVQSVGLTVYYTARTGVKIVSPTVEGGLLSGLSLLSLGTVPVTYAAGGTVGAVNQVAFTTAGPVAGATEAAASTGLHSVAYVGFLAYDAVEGSTKIVINQAASGIVLGYNALTAIPAQAFLGAVDVVVLAYDGPRLVIAAARGRIKTGKDGKESYSLGDLPVGTVVDLKKLQNTEGVTVEVISTDPAVIKDVLEKTPEDLRVKDNADK
jgi:hypothetical protein